MTDEEQAYERLLGALATGSMAMEFIAADPVRVTALAAWVEQQIDGMELPMGAFRNVVREGPVYLMALREHLKSAPARGAS